MDKLPKGTSDQLLSAGLVRDGGAVHMSCNRAFSGEICLDPPIRVPNSPDQPVPRRDIPESSHVLVVEDDRETRLLLIRFLSENGLRATGARDGREMWEALERAPVDIVLLDVMLPGTTGLDLCRALREKSSIPVIIVTARTSETDRVLGLEFGADDYVLKPFSRPELLARVRAVLRRAAIPPRGFSATGHRVLAFNGWRLDTARRDLTAPTGAAVDLSGAEFDLLLAFLEHPQRVLTRDQILELARNRAGEVFDRSVDVLVSRLRRKIEPENGHHVLIKTVRGTGYMFVPDVTPS